MGLFRRKKKKKVEDLSEAEIEEMRKRQTAALDLLKSSMKSMDVKPIQADIDKCLECGSTKLYKEEGVVVCQDCGKVFRIEK